jgi:hypothetical protein
MDYPPVNLALNTGLAYGAISKQTPKPLYYYGGYNVNGTPSSSYDALRTTTNQYSNFQLPLRFPINNYATVSLENVTFMNVFTNTALRYLAISVGELISPFVTSDVTNTTISPIWIVPLENAPVTTGQETGWAAVYPHQYIARVGGGNYANLTIILLDETLTPLVWNGSSTGFYFYITLRFE